MRRLVEAFSQQLQTGLELARKNPWQPPGADNPHEIVLMGLGGSAFGGEVVRNYLYDRCSVPFTVYRGYTSPAHIGPQSLVILSSYSGNTEETLSAATEAHRRGARLVAITSGGKLADWAEDHADACFTLPPGYPPRAACGFSIVQQLEILHRLQLIADYVPALEMAIRKLQAYTPDQYLHDLARKASGKWLAIYSEDRIESIAIRLRQQINENANQLCHHHVIPEMNHNELVGWELPALHNIPRLVLFLRHPDEHPRNQLRYAFLQEEAGRQGIETTELRTDATDKLTALLDLLHQSDWLSILLAEINGVDPMPVEVIDRLKNRLAQQA